MRPPPLLVTGTRAAEPPSRGAGRRWKIEESFQAAKTGLGLDQHQNRRRTSWPRWTTLAILAYAFRAAATAHRDRPDPIGLIALTVNELRHLLNVLNIDPTRRYTDRCSGRFRRRRHQAPSNKHRSRRGDRAVTALAPLL